MSESESNKNRDRHGVPRVPREDWQRASSWISDVWSQRYLRTKISAAVISILVLAGLAGLVFDAIQKMPEFPNCEMVAEIEFLTPRPASDRAKIESLIRSRFDMLFVRQKLVQGSLQFRPGGKNVNFRYRGRCELDHNLFNAALKVVARGDFNALGGHAQPHTIYTKIE